MKQHRSDDEVARARLQRIANDLKDKSTGIADAHLVDFAGKVHLHVETEKGAILVGDGEEMRRVETRPRGFFSRLFGG